MIIAISTAKKLAKAGKATIEDCTTTDEHGNSLRLVTRHDLQRMDHIREA